MSIESRSNQYGTVFGHWQIRERLGGGSGGKTAVFRLVRTDSPQVTGALKVISLIEERGRLEDFSDERRADYAQACKQCRDSAEQEVLLMYALQGNSNIVDYKDHGFVDWADDTGFGRDMLIRMELLQDLRGELRRGRQFTEAEALRVGQDICKALILCHEKNILHRDIKPENIFISRNGDYKLGDFGVSRILGASPSAMASTGIGTPEYAAPEQFHGTYNNRVDIYSLGLVLYELTNRNRLPFASSSYVTPDVQQKRQMGAALPRPCDASDALASVILKACAFRPEDRYQTAREFLDALYMVNDSCSTVKDPAGNYKTVMTTGGGDQEQDPYGTQPGTVSGGDSNYTRAAAGGGSGQNQTAYAAGNDGSDPVPGVDLPRDIWNPPDAKKSIKWLLCLIAILLAVLLALLLFGGKKGGSEEGEGTEAPGGNIVQTEPSAVQTEPAPTRSYEMQIIEAADSYAEAGQYRLAIQTIRDAQKTKDSPELMEALLGYHQAFSTHRIAAGRRHSMAVLDDGSVLTRGYSERGTCNTGFWSDVISAAAGDFHVLGLTSSGSVLADGPADFYMGVSNWQNITVIAAGDGHCVGLRSDGMLEAAGLNAHGQCNVRNLYSTSPVVSIAAGYEHTVALHADGTVTAIGRNDFGQCEVSNWTNIVAISAGSEHTIGLRADGTVVAAGKYSDGQCNISSWRDIEAISAGDYYTVGLKSDGTVLAVGSNLKGQCNVSGWTNVVEIAAGNAQTLGICADGTIVYAGDPAYRLS